MEKSLQKDQLVKYPEIYLAIDNCFASKRYTEPEDWMEVISQLGIVYVEASADTECDPLYMGREYLGRWVDKVKKASEKTKISVCNLYSGHGTYSTLGLSHTDPMVRARMLNDWLKPMVDAASALDAGLGFFCHAFNNHVLQDPVLYEEYKNELFHNLAEISSYSHATGCKAIGVEQMYSPHQIPWTIKGAKELINQVSEKLEAPFYITIDTGHQSGQRKFLKPDKTELTHAIEQFQAQGQTGHLWLGPDKAYNLFETCKGMNESQVDVLIKQIFDEMDNYPYLFPEIQDSSTYRWIEELACYSPIIHLQQTDGKTSGHWPFTKTNNDKGIIEGEKVLEAIKASYENHHDSSIPKVDRIYLTIEVFASTASINQVTINQLKETVNYWRQFIPEDGKKLNELT